MLRILHVLTASAAVVMLVAGCSSGSSTAAVASLDEEGDVAAPAAESSTELTERSALEFAQCMRDNGVDDFPDPTVDSEGNVTIGGGAGGAGGQAGGGVDREATATARDACGDLIDGVTFGGGRGRELADNTELQDALVAYTDCLRTEGLDVGDVDLGGGGESGAGGAPGRGGGQRGEGGVDGGPGGRIAEQLGLDSDDPAVAAALEVCQPSLDEAFGGVGPGGN